MPAPSKCSECGAPDGTEYPGYGRIKVYASGICELCLDREERDRPTGCGLMPSWHETMDELRQA